MRIRILKRTKYKGKHTANNTVKFIIIMAALIAVVLIAIFLAHKLSKKQTPKPTTLQEPDVVTLVKTEYIKVPTYIKIPTYIEIPTLMDEAEYTDEVTDILAKLLYGECRGCSDVEQAAVVWCVLNRADSNLYPNEIVSVITQKDQFSGYSESHPVWDNLKSIARDVLARWDAEKNCVGDIGRVLPKDYLYFHSDGNGHNVFRTQNGRKMYHEQLVSVSPYGS